MANLPAGRVSPLKVIAAALSPHYKWGWLHGYPAGYYGRAYYPNQGSTGAAWSRGYTSGYMDGRHDQMAGRPYDSSVH
jgi:hypothetical protein